MSESDNLADSFGQPARSLSTMLPPRRRRVAREENTAAVPAPSRADREPRQAPSTAPEDADEEPTLPERSRAGSDPATTPSPDSAGGPAPRSPRSAEAGPPPPASGRPGAAGRRGTGRTTTRATAPVSVDDHTSYQVVVYVHPSVKSVATTQRREQKVSNAEIAFDAIDAVQHRLDGLIKTRRLQSRPESSLFPGRVRRGRVNGGGAVATEGDARRVLWGFRATGQELAVIDRLVERSGAESRSELVATALEEVLLQA